MADGTVIIDTDLDSSGIESKLSKLGSTASKGLGVITKAVAAVGAALHVVGLKATQVGMGFESSMSQVKAVSGATAEEFDLLSEKAKEMGSKTQFSAEQCADALGYMALAGWDVDQMIGEVNGKASALESILSLAAASGMDLATASDAVTDILSAFTMEASEAGLMADQFAYAQANANTSALQLTEAMKNCGVNANTFGQDITGTNAVLMALSNEMLKGSEAGTALSAVYRDMTSKMKDGAIAIGDTKVKITDANGNFRDMSDIIKDVEGATNGMSESQRSVALASTFTADSIKAMGILLNEGSDKIKGYEEGLRQCEGAAKNLADTANDNLKGDLSALNSSVEGFGIQLYETFTVNLRESAQNATDSMGRLSDALKNNGLNGLIEEAGVLLSEFMVSVAEYAPKVVTIALELIQSFVGSIQTNLPIITQSAVQIFDTLLRGLIETLPQVLQMGIDIIIELANGLSQTLPTLVPVAVDAIITLAETLIDNFDTIIDAGIELIFALVDGLITALPTLIEKVPEIINKFWEAFDKNLFKIIQAGMELIVKLGKGIIDNIPVIIANAGEIVSAIVNTISHINMLQIGKNLMTNLGNGIKNMAGNIKTRATDISNSIKTTLANTNVAQVGKNLMTNLSNGIKGMASNVVSQVKNIGKNIVEGLWNGITSMGSWITSKISGFFSGIVDSAKKVLGIHSPSRIFRDEVGKYMAEGVSVGFEAETDNVKADIQSSLTDLTAKMRATVEYEQGNYVPTGVTKYTSTNSVSNDATSDDERTIVVEATFNVDGRQMAKATATHMDRELNKISERKKRGG